LTESAADGSASRPYPAARLRYFRARTVIDSSRSRVDQITIIS